MVLVAGRCAVAGAPAVVLLTLLEGDVEVLGPQPDRRGLGARRRLGMERVQQLVGERVEAASTRAASRPTPSGASSRALVDREPRGLGGLRERRSGSDGPPPGSSTTSSSSSTRTRPPPGSAGVPNPPGVASSAISLPVAAMRAGETTCSATRCSAARVAAKLGGQVAERTTPFAP